MGKFDWLTTVVCGVINPNHIKDTFSELKPDGRLSKALLNHGKDAEARAGRADVKNFIHSQFMKNDLDHEDYKGKEKVPTGWAISTEQVQKDDVEWKAAGGDLDILVGFACICPWLVYAAGGMGGVIMRLIPQLLSHNMTAIALYRGATTLCEVVVAFQVFLLWITFCFKFGSKHPDVDHPSRVRNLLEKIFTKKTLIDGKKGAAPEDYTYEDRIDNFWKTSIAGQTGLMIGGFAPRVAALSMGFLLFAGGTLVSPDNKPGKGGLASMIGYDGCRANGAEYADDVWFKRIYRHPAEGCLGGSEEQWYNKYFKSGDTFVVEDLLDAGARWNFTKDGHQVCEKATLEAVVNCWKWDGGKNAIFKQLNGTGMDWKDAPFITDAPIPIPLKMTRTGGKEGTTFEPTNLVHPWNDAQTTHDSADDTLKHYACGYQCVKWKQLSVSAVIKVSGAVFTGAFFLTKIIEGWTSAMGYKLIKPDTDVTKLVELLAVVRQYRTKNKCFGRCAIFLRTYFRRTACALQLAFFWILSYILAPTLNIDGFFTSDYYTTLIFIFAGLVSLSQRYYSTYQAAPLLYTSNLWLKGVDEFVAPGENGGEASKKKVTLYDWIHLTPEDRGEYLFRYARSVSEDEVKAMKGDLTDPLRSVISVSFCVDNNSITDFALAKTVPRLLGMPHGAHGMIHKMESGGRYEVQWKRVIGCGTKDDLEIEHIRFLVDIKQNEKGDLVLAVMVNGDLAIGEDEENPQFEAPKLQKNKKGELAIGEDEGAEENLTKMRDALCSNKVVALSEQGKAFIVGCGLKWHVLYNEKKASRTVVNLDESATEMSNTWPKKYMANMAKFKGLGATWDERLKAAGVAETLAANNLHLFWGKDCRRDGKLHKIEDCTLKDMRWEGYVQPYMVLESNAQWQVARQLLGLRALRPGKKVQNPEDVVHA